MLKAVIFDLDDTLYDHLFSARHGLRCMQSRYPAMQSVSVRELEDRYSEALESVHLRLLRGEVTQQEARTDRMQRLFASFGIEADAAKAMAEYRQFRADYDAVSQVVVGSHELLKELQKRDLRLAVITNNLVSEQIPKLQQLGLTNYFEVVSISEEVGIAKPDPKIFELTLERLHLQSQEVVMVGDSLSSDIAGATNAGIRSVWLKRRPESPIEPPPSVSIVLGDFADLTAATKAIRGVT